MIVSVRQRKPSAIRVIVSRLSASIASMTDTADQVRCPVLLFRKSSRYHFRNVSVRWIYCAHNLVRMGGDRVQNEATDEKKSVRWKKFRDELISLIQEDELHLLEASSSSSDDVDPHNLRSGAASQLEIPPDAPRRGSASSVRIQRALFPLHLPHLSRVNSFWALHPVRHLPPSIID